MVQGFGFRVSAQIVSGFEFSVSSKRLLFLRHLLVLVWARWIYGLGLSTGLGFRALGFRV